MTSPTDAVAESGSGVAATTEVSKDGGTESEAGGGAESDTSFEASLNSSIPDLMKVSDLVGDRDNAAASPSYSEVVEASVKRSALNLEFVVRFHEPLPAKLSDENEKFTAGFNLETDEGRAFALIGVVSQEGWESSFQETSAKAGIVGRFSVKGSEIRFIVRAAEFGHYETFRWAAGGALSRSVPESAPVMLAWDVVPNDGPTTFPDS